MSRTSNTSDSPATRTSASGGGRNLLVLGDTAVNALTGVLMVVGAARALGPADLSNFTLGHLLINTVLGIQRAGLLNPALAAQRSSGRAFLPVSWAFRVSVPLGLVAGASLGPLIGWSAGALLHWALIGALAGAAVLAQDTLRMALISKGRLRLVLVADVLTLLAIGLGTLFRWIPTDPLGVVAYWAGSVLLAVGVGVLTIRIVPRRSECQKPQTLANAWRLGRWSTADTGLAAVATLLPMFTANLLIDPASSGLYRVLQTALGPLNILHTSIMTIFSLDAWGTNSLAGIIRLRTRVRQLVALLGGVSIAYVVVGEMAVVWIARLSGDELVRIAVIVGVTGVLGAMTTPVNSAALALGYQKYGVAVRGLILVSSMAISAAAALGWWVPWDDPIGTSFLVSALVTLIGWGLVYRSATHREVEKLRTPVP